MAKRQRMTEKVFDLIRTDRVLRQTIAISEGVQDNSVRVLAINKSSKLTEFNILNIIREHTGLKDKDIFEPIK